MIKSQLKLIAEIHNEFDTAQERLLHQANEILKSGNERVTDIADRLKTIGFVNTPTAKKGGELKQQIVKSKEQAELIQYYQFNYPFLKFLTEDELNRICEKYDLIHAPVLNYIKEVPEKNLRDIERAQQLKVEDANKITYRIVIDAYWYDVPSEIRDIFSKGVYTDNPREANSDLALSKLVREHGYKGTYRGYIFTSAHAEMINKSGLFIAAPKSHFDLKGLNKKSKHGFFNVLRTELKDPIVFRYVRGGIQVITKWGLEAEDPSLVVEKLN